MDFKAEINSESKKLNEKTEALVNNIFNLSYALGDSPYPSQQLSQTDTIVQNNRYYFISINRVALSWMYATFGIIQTMIDQPVDDAFRNGFKIKSGQLDEDDVADVWRYFKEHEIVSKAKQVIKWKRLFGGAGMVINTIGNPNRPLNPDLINEKTPLEFYPADLWELSYQQPETYGEPKPYQPVYYDNQDPFFFYGVQLNKSRVLRLKGKEAPSFSRPMLRGWGMSEIEAMIRDANKYMKADDVIFEILDEAKIDVWKMTGFNTAMLSSEGVSGVAHTVQAANRIKNFQSAIVMDKDDDYDQKQLSFAGLSDICQQNRIGVASSMRMPMAKIFGMSAAGFNSGEDDIENYNTIVETIRSQDESMILQITKLVCQKLKGFMPDDLEIEWPALRILNAEQEENVKTSQFNRINAAYSIGAITIEQYLEQCNAANIFPTKVKIETTEDFPKPPESPMKATTPVDIAKNSKKKSLWKMSGLKK